VPRLAGGAEQADARSLMTGRITDAYTNIATVKLFSHAQREASFARGAMQEFLGTVHAQMRLVTGFEIVNQLLSVLLIASPPGVALWLWTAARSAWARWRRPRRWRFRLNGISHWVMWEMATLFEHIGTVQDGIGTLSRPHSVVDRPPGAKPLVVTRARCASRSVGFAYGGKRKPVIDDLELTSGRARRSAWSAARAPARARSSTCCCASTTCRRAAS
jgi:ATP-binding cassette, subfamily B, multidrug efflux pump